MAIYDLTISKELKAMGGKMGREEIALRALVVAEQIVRVGSYKNAIAGIGRMMMLGQCCNFDHYWKEKRDIGKSYEVTALRVYKNSEKYPEMQEVG